MIRYGGVTLLSGLLLSASVFSLVGQSQPAAAKAQDAATLLAAAEPAIAEKLIARGDELFKLGDVAAARLLYERAAHEGSARAGTAVGRTFDPFYFEASGLVAAAADPVRAIRWYKKSAANGDADAGRRLKALAAWLQLDSAENVTDATVAARYAVIMEARRVAAADRRQAAEASRQRTKKKKVAVKPERTEKATEVEKVDAAEEPVESESTPARDTEGAAKSAEEQRAAERAAEQAAREAQAEQAAQRAAEERAIAKEKAVAERAARRAAEQKAVAERAAAELAAGEAAERQAAAEQAAAERATATKRAAERRARLEAEEGARETDSEIAAEERAAADWAAAGRAERQAAAERGETAPQLAPTTTGQIADAEPAAGGSVAPTENADSAAEAATPQSAPAADGDISVDQVESPGAGAEPESEQGDSVAALIERQRAAATPGPESRTANRPTAEPWQTTEDGIRYRVEEGPNGFFVSVYHAPINIIPDTAEIELECRQAVSEMARRVATDYGRLVRPIEDERIRTTTWRNTIDIRTRCIGTTLVEYRE